MVLLLTLEPMFQKVFSSALAFFLLLSPRSEAAEAQGVTVTELAGKVRFEIRGELFTEYHFAGAPHVYFYPVVGPGGPPMTRAFPMQAGLEGEEQDHPHHRSLWYSHGSVNGVDFWSEGPKAGKIVHGKFLELKSGANSGVIRSENHWIAPDGEVVCTDERTFRVYARPASERLFDFEITLKAGGKEVVLGDTKEGSMGIRIAESMRLTVGKNQPGQGHIVQSTGVRDGATWGKRAEWCDYYGPIRHRQTFRALLPGKREEWGYYYGPMRDRILGIAIFDHPQNPKHPTWWHVRDYGLFAANPFGLHDFEKKPPGTGNFVIPAGQTATFRYRFYLHEGDEQQAKVAARYHEYTRPSK